MPGLFDGVRVVELADGLPGPFCGKLLAGMGMDVVKVEPPRGDSARRDGPFPGAVPHPEKSGQFLHLNTSKRSLTADTGTADGQTILRGLLTNADIVILDLPPSRLAALHLEPACLQQEWPRLIVASVTPFGLSGPYAEYLGPELVACALSGYMTLTGFPDREPLKPYGSLLGYQAGLHAATGSLAALIDREQSGTGALIDVSIMEAGVFLLGSAQLAAHFFGKRIVRDGARNVGGTRDGGYPSTIRPCKGGFVHCHLNARHRDLLSVLMPDPRWDNPELMKFMHGHADEIDAIMDDWLADKDKFEVTRMAQELRLPFTEVMTTGEVMHDEHYRERETFVAVQHPVAGEVVQPGAPLRMTGFDWRTEAAPTLGHDTRELLGSLGYTAEDMVSLRAAGVI